MNDGNAEYSGCSRYVPCRNSSCRHADSGSDKHQLHSFGPTPKPSCISQGGGQALNLRHRVAAGQEAAHALSFSAMDISRFPSEILSVILAHLSTPELPWPNDVKQVANARLVCRQWNDLATPHLFHSLHIGHHGSSLRPWDALLDVPHVRNAVQRVTVLAAPVATMQEWNGRWSEGAQKATYHALMECVARIAELPNLRELDVRFHQWCAGPQRLRGMGVDWRSDFELPLANDDVFRTVFVALRNRVAKMLPATPVRSLLRTHRTCPSQSLWHPTYSRTWLCTLIASTYF